VGEPTCRDDKFLGYLVKFADQVVTNSFVLNMFPKILHGIVGRLVCLPNWWYWRKAANIVLPKIRERLDGLLRKDAGAEDQENWKADEDFITWLIRQATIEGNVSELDPEMISKRLLPIEFAAIHTTVITGHFLLIDLLTSDPTLGYLDAIREETSRVYKEEGSRWTKEGLARLYKTDSAIRESQRRSNFATSLTKRKVVAPTGVTNRTEGWTAPYGAFLSLSLAGVQHDKDIYENPNEYDAFRFSRVRMEYLDRPAEEKDPEEALRVAKLGMVTTSDSHLAFGHGRHAW
jgi:cytochrome P450